MMTTTMGAQLNNNEGEESHHQSSIMFYNKKSLAMQQDTAVDLARTTTTTTTTTTDVLPLTNLSANNMEYHHNHHDHHQCDDNNTNPTASTNDEMGVDQQWFRRRLQQQQGIVSKMTAQIRRLESENAQNKEMIKQLSCQSKSGIYRTRNFNMFAVRDAANDPSDSTATNSGSGTLKHHKWTMEVDTINDRMKEYGERNAVESPINCKRRSVFIGTGPDVLSNGSIAQRVSPPQESGNQSSRTKKRRRRGGTKSKDGRGDDNGLCKDEDGKERTDKSSSERSIHRGDAKNVTNTTTRRRGHHKISKSKDEGQSTGHGVVPSAATIVSKKKDEYDDINHDTALMRKRKLSQHPLPQDCEFNSLHLLLDAAGKKNNNNIDRHIT